MLTLYDCRRLAEAARQKRVDEESRKQERADAEMQLALLNDFGIRATVKNGRIAIEHGELELTWSMGTLAIAPATCPVCGSSFKRQSVTPEAIGEAILALENHRCPPKQFPPGLELLNDALLCLNRDNEQILHAVALAILAIAESVIYNKELR